MSEVGDIWSLSSPGSDSSSVKGTLDTSTPDLTAFNAAHLNANTAAHPASEDYFEARVVEGDSGSGTAVAEPAGPPHLEARDAAGGAQSGMPVTSPALDSHFANCDVEGDSIPGRIVQTPASNNVNNVAQHTTLTVIVVRSCA